MDLGDRGMRSAISKNCYDVFISFRGPDTRQGFTNCLYHALIDAGIRVFTDEDDLTLGGKIDEILTALDNSTICIILLSPGFAESVWCLREVGRMVDRKKHIVPVFYHVTPDDVKLKTGLYANALIKHEAKYGKEQVRKWRDALKDISAINGRELKTSGFTEFSKQLAREILTKLKVKSKYEIVNLVHVPDELEAALKFLDIGSGGRRFLGIHGMGGIGKTTLAKIIFNQIIDNYDCSCFLESIQEYLSQHQDGLQKLQERLLKSLDPSLRDATHISDVRERMKNYFARKKVIIVLDQINNIYHIDHFIGDFHRFGEGSRIIFTTRNAYLHEQVTSYNGHVYGLEKREMDYKQALKLFSWHAFGEDSPPKDFEILSAEAISTTGRLPLALVVVGSLLHRRKAGVWRDVIKRLEVAPHLDVQRKLKLSYDALEYDHQEIFLDIACFFIGVKKTNAFYMWEACEFYPYYGIEVLISMSLIKLNEKECFWMNDQLRDLGRAIVKVNSEDARAGSRIWMHKDAIDLLKRNSGKEKVEALHLDGPSVDLDYTDFFVGLKRLRFLRWENVVDFRGNFDGLFPKLRWLSLQNVLSFSATNLCLRELIVLELNLCRFDETWEGWSQILVSPNLKVLTLSGFSRLISTPDLSRLENLERLVLHDCENLSHIHDSLGKLQHVRHLDITKCAFCKLPEEFTSLKGMRETSAKCASECVTDNKHSVGMEDQLKEVTESASGSECVADNTHLVGMEVQLKEVTEGASERVVDNSHLVGMEVQEEEVTRGTSKLFMNTHSVGMEDQVKEVMKLLDVESGGMFFVGIHGTGGVGKTTLAKVVFDQLSTYFQVCSFIRDIREKSKSKGIEYLQDELLRKILGTNKDDEMETMKDTLFNKKILIVLDDIDQKEQINNLVGKFSWLGPGSRIIITTRNKKVMAIEHERLGRSTLEWPKFEAFEMRQMEHGRALQLFNKRALGEDSSTNEHTMICKEIVDATGRLPLALEIVGSYLRDKTAVKWGSTLIKLKKICHEDIEEKLKISYEALDQYTQQIFLDIACFFCDKELSFPLYMWGACGSSPDQRIRELKSLSLIQIMDDNKLWMHGLIREFGRKIVRENAMDPANLSRVWVHDEILYILEEKKEETEKSKRETEAIGVYGHDFPWALSLSREELEGLPKLRYLELCRFQFAGDLSGCSLSNLKWLLWNLCPPDFNAINLHLDSLVILDLSRSRITHQWGGWAQITMANLEVLNLSCCENLISTPDLSGYKKLESLILENCVNLATIDCTIGELEQLKYLNLKGCSLLNKLPEELLRAKKLEKILVSGDGQSFEIPELFGGLTLLLVLEIANVKITAIPSDIGELKSLVRLDLSGAEVTELPASFGNMMKLLKVIKLDSSSIRQLPSSIGKLSSLEELYCRNCEELLEIPVEIGELHSLKILDLSDTGISSLPETIGELDCLETLNLEPCDELVELPHCFPESLVNLSVASKKLKNIPYNAVPKGVIHLKLTTGCKSSSFHLSWVGKLYRLKTLELCFPLITGLELASSTELYSLCLSSKYLECFSQLPSSLSRLFMAHLNVETVIPNLSRLKKLAFLELRGLAVSGEIGFAELESVEHLSVHNCKFSSLPRKLRALYISKCKFSEGVLDLTGLNHLVHLEIMDCKQLIHVRGVAGLKSLEEINISKCKSLETVDSLFNLNRLEALKLESCRNLRQVNGLDRIADSLKQFEIYNCKRLRTATEEVSKKRKWK